MLRNEQYLDQLFEQLRRNVERPASDQEDGITLVARWSEGYMSEYEKLIHRPALTMYYRVMYGEDKLMDFEHHYYAWEPLRMVTFETSKLAAFVKAHNLDLANFQAVLEGKVQDEKGWRSYPYTGAANRPYTPPREVHIDRDTKPNEQGYTKVYKNDYKVGPTPSNEMWEG